MTTDNQQLLRLAHILKISTVIFFQLILISSPLRACQKVPLLPPELQEVPFAEDAHIVQNSKILNIKGVSCAFNASIAQKDDGYIIVFREDIKPLNSTRIEIRTGYAYFDKNFQQISDTFYYAIPHQAAHDVRIFYHNNRLNLIYTHLILGDTPLAQWNPYTTLMRPALATINEDGSIASTTELNYGSVLREKNWTPFEFKDGIGLSHLYLVYAFNPIEIICVDESGTITPIVKQTLKSEQLANLWENRWGQIRGGTQALSGDNEYLTFFHSCFLLSNKRKCYIFGALTFENQFPFRITKISPYPIITRDFYTTIDCECMAHKLVKENVMFPCGVVQEQKDGRDVFYITSGENDHAIRLITVDKEYLMQSMVTVTRGIS